MALEPRCPSQIQAGVYPTQLSVHGNVTGHTCTEFGGPFAPGGTWQGVVGARTGCQGLSTGAERGFVRSQSRSTAGRDLCARARHCRETPGAGSRGGRGATASPVLPRSRHNGHKLGHGGVLGTARGGDGAALGTWGHERRVVAPARVPRNAAGVKLGDRGVTGTLLQGQGQGREQGRGLAPPLAVDGSRWPGKAPACRGTGTPRWTMGTITGPPTAASGEGCGNGVSL